MKKLILNSILLSVGFGVYAQTNSIASGNDATEANDGYTFEYNQSPDEVLFTSESINCLDDAGIHSGAGTFGYDVNAGAATYTTNGTTGAIKVLFTIGNCSNTTGLREGNDGLDVSDVKNQKITIELNSAVAANLIVDGIYGAAGTQAGQYADGWNPATAIAEGDNVLELTYFPTHTNAGDEIASASSGANGLLGFYLYFRDGSDAASALAENTEFKITRISVGENTTVGTNDKVLANSITAYPNPATTNVNFETTLENVTIYNVVGLPVFEAQSASSVDVSSFDSGVYFIQHAAGTTRFTVQ